MKQTKISQFYCQDQTTSLGKEMWQVFHEPAVPVKFENLVATHESIYCHHVTISEREL